MKNEIRKKLELLVANWREIRSEFFWTSTMIKRMAAFIYAREGKAIDCDAIKQSLDLIKENTGVFSTFRGNMTLCVATLLSLKDNPAELFPRVLTVYEMMKDVKFRASDYLVLAAYEIAANSNPEDYERIVGRAKAFYDGMKENSFFRTGQDDYIFAAMLGLSDIDAQTGAARIERLYRHFKPEFWSGNGVQALAQVLVLSGDCEAAANRVLKLRDALKERNMRLDKTYTLPSLGVLALFPADENVLASDIDEARAFLRKQKGFGGLSVNGQELLLYASAVVASEYADEIQNGNLSASVYTSIASIILAQQAATIAAISGATVAATSASSN